MTSLAKRFRSVYRRSDNFLLEFRLVTHSGVKQSYKAMQLSYLKAVKQFYKAAQQFYKAMKQFYRTATEFYKAVKQSSTKQ